MTDNSNNQSLPLGEVRWGLRWGLTGCMGSGKSYVSKLLADRGVEVYDCDAAAKRLMRNDLNLQERLSEAVGKEVFPDGKLDKAVLTQFLLASEENAHTIDSIVHPAVFADFMASGLRWVESAILFECGMDKLVDKTVCVSAPLEVRLQRIQNRDNISREKALEWVGRQMPQEEKERLADHVIINDGKADLVEQIDGLGSKV